MEHESTPPLLLNALKLIVEKHVQQKKEFIIFVSFVGVRVTHGFYFKNM